MGQDVYVRVISVDFASGKVGLSMKSDAPAAGGGGYEAREERAPREERGERGGGSFSRRAGGDGEGEATGTTRGVATVLPCGRAARRSTRHSTRSGRPLGGSAYGRLCRRWQIGFASPRS
jgi:hypothetical protein